MVLLNMLMKIALPKTGELLVMMMTMISTFGREVPRRNRSAEGQKCSCTSSALRRRRSVPKVLSLFFFLGQNDLYTRRWAPEVGRGGHNPRQGAWRAQVGCAHLVAPLWWLSVPVILIYSIKNPREVSACLELCRIGSLT